MATVDELTDTMQKILNMQMDGLSNKELKEAVGQTALPAIEEKVKFELQSRQINETIKWQKWVAIGTGALAIATFILAISTFI